MQESVEGMADIFKEAPDCVKRLASSWGVLGARARLAQQCAEYHNTCGG